jgi:hypothetical protein
VAVFVLLVVACCCPFASSQPSASRAEYYGTEIGELQSFAHDVRGRVYVVDDETFFIKGFRYDGTAPGKLKTILELASIIYNVIYCRVCFNFF